MHKEPIIAKEKRSLERKERDKLIKKAKLERWVQCGLSRNGFVKKHTKVLQCDIPNAIQFMESPLFGTVPYVSARYVPPHLVSELADLESYIISKSNTKDYVQHKYGANGGMNLGISVVSGGVHAEKSKNISGSIHYSSVIKKYPELRGRLYSIIKEILDTVYGHCTWHRRMCLITEKLNYDSNEERAIPGIPVSKQTRKRQGSMVDGTKRSICPHCG